jgi:hypothetical protein
MATATDAEVVLRLYELRREETMRKARTFVAMEFQPKTFAEFQVPGSSMGTPENAYWRQVLSYWEMAASMVLRGAVDPDLFVDGNGEGIFLYAKFRQFHEQYQQVTGMPFMRRTAELVQTVPAAKEVYDRVVKMLEARAS